MCNTSVRSLQTFDGIECNDLAYMNIHLTFRQTMVVGALGGNYLDVSYAF